MREAWLPFLQRYDYITANCSCQEVFMKKINFFNLFIRNLAFSLEIVDFLLCSVTSGNEKLYKIMLKLFPICSKIIK